MKSWHYTLATYIAGACLLVLLVHLQLSLVSGPAKSSGGGSRVDPIRDADEYGGRTGADDNEGTRVWLMVVAMRARAWAASTEGRVPDACVM